MKYFKEIIFLLSLPRIGKATVINEYSDLLLNGTSFDELIEKVSNKSANVKKCDIDLAVKKADAAIFELMSNDEITAITYFDEEYPKKLKDLKGKAPVILYVKGNVSALNDKNIAIVGTRKPSEWSEKIETNLVKQILDLSERVIVSGLAIGCDYIAHKTTVDEKRVTIAVLPSGINTITPKKHVELANRIIECGGCLISEYEANQAATNASYVERDAIIAALADSTFVVECDVKSGTMHTVEEAKKLKKRLACYYCDDVLKGQYSGNRHMVQSMDAIKVSNMEELKLYLSELDDKCGTEFEMQQLSLWDMLKNN